MRLVEQGRLTGALAGAVESAIARIVSLGMGWQGLALLSYVDDCLCRAYRGAYFYGLFYPGSNVC